MNLDGASLRNSGVNDKLGFMERLQTILTDNGTQFTDRFTSQGKRASGKHVFDVSCAEMGIGHRLSPPRHPQTNGMVERFNASHYTQVQPA